MTEREIIAVCEKIKRANLAIPLNVVEFMKSAAIEKIANQNIMKCDICGEPAYYSKGSGNYCDIHRHM